MDINNEFLEEFKKLDKMLSDAFGERHGVTAYINEMKTKWQYDIGWREDFERLKKLRNIRNNLVHEVGYGGIQRVTKEDIDFIKNFHKRFLERKDPLAQIRKRPKENQPIIQINNQPREEQRDWALIAFYFVAILVFSVLIGLIIKINS